MDEAHSLLIEKIALESRNSSKNNHGVLADTLVLAEVLFKKSAFAEALLYGRRALKSYRRMGPEGIQGVQSSLGLLCQVCKASGNHDQEDAYSAILSDILQQHPRVAESTTNSTERNNLGLSKSSKPPLPNKPLSLKSPSVESARSQDTMRYKSWTSSSPSTSTSISDRAYRRDSLFSAGLLGPSSPNTEYSFSSSKSQKELPGAEDLSPHHHLDSSSLSSTLDNSAAASDETKFDDVSRFRQSTYEHPVTPYGKETSRKDEAMASSPSTEWIPVVAGIEKIADVRTYAARGSTSVNVHEVNVISTDQPLVERSPIPPPLPKHETREDNENGEQTAEGHSEPIQTHVGDMPGPAINSGSINDADVIHKSPLLLQPQPDVAQGMSKVSVEPTNYEAPKVEDQKDESEDAQQVEKTSEPLLQVQLTAPKLPPSEPLPPPKWINDRNDLDNDHQKPVDPIVARKLSKRESPEFKFCDPRAHHVHSSRLECAAVEYFRAGRGNPPEPVEPVCLTPRVPIKVSDYELLEWIGTLSDVPSVAKPDASMDGLIVPSLEVSLPKTLWKSKSAVDLFNSGIVELPGELLGRRKSTVDLHSSTLIADCPSKPMEAKPAVGGEIDWKAWYAPKPLEEAFSVVDGGIDWTAWYGSPNYVDGTVKGTVAHTIPTPLPPQPQAKTIGPVNLVGLTKVGPDNEAMLNTLVEMGYTRAIALSALKRCNWNIERAANDLASEVTEEADSLENVGTPQVYVSGADGNGDLSPTKPFSRPVSFQTLIQLQSSALSAHMHRPSLSSLTGDRPESSPSAGTKSHKKSVSFDSAFPNNHSLNPPLQTAGESQRDELLDLPEAGRRLQYQRPKNPLGANLGFQFPAGDVANDLTAAFSHQSLIRPEEQVAANQQSTLEQLVSRTSPTSPSMPSITFSDVVDGQAAIRRKVVICGDVYCGKSSLVSMFSKGVLPEEYHYAEFEIACVQQKAGDKTVELVIWDTGGALNHSSFREKECYSGSHLVVICFAINSPDSLDNAQELFAVEMKKSHSSVRCMLVGLKKDLRYDLGTTRHLLGIGQHAVTPGEGEVAALKIGANIYMECSAKTGEGVKEIFETAAILAMLPNEKLKKMRSFRDMFGKK